MVASGGQPGGAGDPRIRPSRRWYWVAGVMLAGGVACIAFAVAGVFALNRQIADFQRVPVPGQAGVTFTQPGGYVVYIEEPGQCCSIFVGSGGSSAPFPSWSMDVALRPVNGGALVSIGTWQGITETYGITGHQGQVAMYFTIDRPGRYLLATGSAAPGSITDVAVGRGIGRGILVPFILIVAGFLAVLAGVLTGVITGARRRARRLGPGPPVMSPVGDWRSAQSTPGEYVVSPRSYLQGGPVGFGEAIKHGLRDWLVYRGRASRSGYWWFILFTVIVQVALAVIIAVIPASGSTAAPGVLIAVLLVIIALLFVIAAIYMGLAELALLVRRLHDIGRSGWWVLIGLVPLVGPIIVLVFTLLEGTPGPNRYDLAAADAAAGAPPLRCPGCGAQNAEAAQVCARCGAPLASRPPAAPYAAGEPGDSIAVPRELVGQQAKPGARRNVLVIAGGGLAALVAVIVVVALANSPRPSVRGPLTYRGHGVSFDYPAGWQEESGATSQEYGGGVKAKLWSTTVGPGTPYDSISVTAYRTGVAVTGQNIDAAIPYLESLLQQAGMTVRGTPDKITMAGLPGRRFRVTGTVEGTRYASTLVFAFNGTTEYSVNCQSTAGMAAEVTSACDQVKGSFHVGKAATAQNNPQAPQAQTNTQAEQQAHNDLATLQQDGKFTSDLNSLTSDASQARSDLAATRSDAALGTDCYNVSTVKIDASTVGTDASTLSLDRDTLAIDIGTASQDIATMKNDLADLSTSGLPATPGATAAIAAAGIAIKKAVAKANGEIDQVNADVTQAYSVANGMATGSCSRDGPGHPPAPIRHIASK